MEIHLPPEKRTAELYLALDHLLLYDISKSRESREKIVAYLKRIFPEIPQFFLRLRTKKYIEQLCKKLREEIRSLEN